MAKGQVRSPGMVGHPSSFHRPTLLSLSIHFTHPVYQGEASEGTQAHILSSEMLSAVLHLGPLRAAEAVPVCSSLFSVETPLI